MFDTIMRKLFLVLPLEGPPQGPAPPSQEGGALSDPAASRPGPLQAMLFLRHWKRASSFPPFLLVNIK